MHRCTVYLLFDNWQILFLFAKHTNPNQSGQWYSDTSPFNIPWSHVQNFALQNSRNQDFDTNSSVFSL
jgi:hypothetical protein